MREIRKNHHIKLLHQLKLMRSIITQQQSKIVTAKSRHM